jgi:hypothetical protein
MIAGVVVAVGDGGWRAAPSLRVATCCIVVLALSFAATAFADTNREEWTCPNTAGVWCTNGGTHSYGSATAVNDSDSYNKCANITMHGVGTIAQQCLFLTSVRTQTDDGLYARYVTTQTMRPRASAPSSRPMS